MKIKLTELNYVFNEEGETQAIEVQYQSYEEGHHFDARVVLTDDHLDDMTRRQIDQAAKETLIHWLQSKESPF